MDWSSGKGRFAIDSLVSHTLTQKTASVEPQEYRTSVKLSNSAVGVRSLNGRFLALRGDGFV